MKINLLLSFLLILFFVPSAFAQQSNVNFKHITVEEGLSQSTVKSVLKDSQGYMWFGTRDGLNRYDGYRITIYKNDSRDVTSISDNFINDIFEDTNGDLWLGTAKGLDKFDRDGNYFKRYSLGESDVDVKHIFQDKKGNMWLATYAGMYLFNSSDGTFKTYKHQEENPNSLINDEINRLTEDAQGNLWIATEGGLDRLDTQNNTFTHFLHDPKNPKGIASNLVKSVYYDSKGNLWVGLRAGGIAFYNPYDHSFISYKNDPANPNTVAHNDIASLVEGPDGNLWIGTENGGISVFDYFRNKFTTYIPDKNDPSSISHNSIHSLYKDNQGNIWAGTWAGGVNLYSPFLKKFTHYSKIPGTSLIGMDAVGGDSDGNIWVGLEEVGLVRFYSKNGKFKIYPNPNQQRFDVSVYDIVELNKDTLAIASRRGGLSFFDKKTARFTHLIPEEGNPASVTGHEKNVVLVDREGNIWTGDWYKGLNCYNRKTKKFTNYLHDSQNPNSISHNRVFAIHEDQDGKLWVGTDGGGLNLFDPKTKKFTRFMHEENNEHSISHNTVFSIMEDSKNRLWIGTYGGGLNLLDRKNMTFTSYTQKDGLPNDVINGILEDGNGNLWMSTNKGLCRFNPETKVCNHFDVKEGLQGNEFTRNACYKAQDGTMYFAGPKGLNVFHPDSIKVNPNIPPVFITDFQIFNESVVPGKEDSPLLKSISQTKDITLPYWKSVFSFEFAALNYTLAEKNKYLYKLEGFDKDWNRVSEHRKATYTNLDPGKYKFIVKATNNDGVWNEEGNFVNILITPPFRKTWWFRTLLAISVIGGALTFYHVRMNAVKAQKAELERQVTDRTSEVMQQKEELQAQSDFLMTMNNELKDTQEELLQQREEIEMQRDNLQQANEQVFSSIQYANTIQKAILPSEEKISQIFPEHFVLYRPKDVVSGDFYWFAHITKEDAGTENDMSFIAVVDCTGHGVPGAFMSIIGHTLLNEIVNLKHILEPDMILEQLNAGVKQTVEKAEGVNTAGMDVCLICIEKGGGNQVKVRFSGAKRSLLYVPKGSKEVKKMNADRRSIGSDSNLAFTTQELILEEGAVLYLTSDGYTDQNDMDRRKFGSVNFNKLVSSLASFPLKEQKAILETALDQHQHGVEQRDDITIIGIKV